MDIKNKLNKILKKGDKATTIFLMLGILVAVNFFSYQLFVRLDLTQNKDYSISSVSKKTVSELDDIVTVKVYFTKKLPSQYITLNQEVGDILDEYANYSNGKVRVDFVDPDSMDEQELYKIGIPPVQFNVLEKDKYEVVKGFLGIVIQYGDKQEVIPVVQSTNNFEYQITTAIKKATSDEMATIGFATGFGAVDPKQMSIAYKQLQELYTVTDINMATAKEVPVEINTLILAGPKESLGEDGLKKLDQFLMRGGSLLVLADGVDIGEGLAAVKNTANLNGLFEKYGFKLNNDLVLDVSSGMASFSSGFFTFSVNYPFWPKILKDGFNQDIPAVAKIESVLLPWSSSINITNTSGAKIDKLISSTNRAWTQSDKYDLNPQQKFIPGKDVGNKVMAVYVSGRLDSAFGQGSNENARMIVVGDSDFASDSFLRQSPDNLILFQNLVDSLSLDNDLINIRSKGISERPLKELGEGQKAFMRYANIFGITIIVVVFGFIRYSLRRRSHFVDEL